MPELRNLILASLPRRTYESLLPGLTRVNLVFGEVLHEPGRPMRHVYFPVEGLVSMLTVVKGRFALEVAMVGREGMVGVPLALGVARTRMRAMVQGSGVALRMSSSRFSASMEHSPPLRKALLSYVDSLMAQIARTAACNRFHVVQARLARWLLMSRDRSGSGDFEMTQEFLSSILGVRRVGVSAAASAFQSRKLIEYSRGRIRIVDHEGLEAACCACYGDEPGTLPPWRPALAVGSPTS